MLVNLAATLSGWRFTVLTDLNNAGIGSIKTFELQSKCFLCFPIVIQLQGTCIHMQHFKKTLKITRYM